MEKFSTEDCHHILRIIQEALNNAKTHAKPTEISVVINHGEKSGSRRIMIFDDGQGFESKKTDDTFSYTKGATHFGMTGMEMRAKLLGGTLTVHSSRKSGLRLD